MASELFRGKKKKQKKNTHKPIFTNIGKIKNRNSHKNRSPISAFGFYFSLVTPYSQKSENLLRSQVKFSPKKGLFDTVAPHPHQILNEWPMNFSAERKKNTLFFFFTEILVIWEIKKNTVFGFG